MLKDHFLKLLEEFHAEADLTKEPYTLDLGSMKIELKRIEEGCYLHARVGEVLPLDKEDFFMFLMKANLLHQNTGDAILGMETNDKYLTLSSDFPYEMTYASFKEKIEDFANFVSYWQGEIKKWQETRQKQEV